MEHLHFSVALRYLLQQLEEQPKDGLKILNRETEFKMLDINTDV